MKSAILQRDEKRDNETLDEKLRWRREALRHLSAEPVICEAYGGWGRVGQAVYRDVRHGVVLEKVSAKAATLALLRPTWSVYEGDTLRMLRAGAGRHLPINFLDLDPYGEPFTTLEAFFSAERQIADRIVIVAHDGMHRLVKMGRAWSVQILEPVVAEFGNSFVKEHYGEASILLVARMLEQYGYSVSDWRWASGGDRKKNAHFLAVVDRDPPTETPQRAPDRSVTQPAA